MIEEKIEQVKKLKGKVVIKLFDKTGYLKDERAVENLIVDMGFDYLCRQIGHNVESSMYFSGIGSSDAAADASQTSLGTELARVSGIYSHTIGTKEFKNEGTFNAGVGTGDVREAALFNASSEGKMLNRQTFGLITKGENDVLKIEWTITLS